MFQRFNGNFFQLFVCCHFRKSYGIVPISRVIVFLIKISGDETVEFYHRPDGSQICTIRTFDSFDFDSCPFDIGGLHLACNSSFPDEFIKLELIVIEIFPDIVRFSFEICRANGFVSFLGVFRLGRIKTWLFGHIFFAECVLNCISCRINCFRCDLNTIGTHIGDKAGCLSAYINSFIELLGNLHCA